MFLFVMSSDPDVPSKAASKPGGEFKHWLVVNIPGNDLKKGEELAAYVGSGPPKGTGKGPNYLESRILLIN